MGIFSFGKKSADAAERRGSGGASGAGRSARSGRAGGAKEEPRMGEGYERGASATRTGRRRAVGQEAMLDPTLPEKQRARRRLVGAIALVLAAVIVLPMVLDARPKPVTSDIAISIPQQPGDRASHDAQNDGDDDPIARVARAHAAKRDDATQGVAPDAAPGTTDLKPDSKSNVPPAATSNIVAPAAVATSSPRQAASVASKAGTVTKPAAPVTSAAAPTSAEKSRDNALPPTPATPGSRYVVQLGAFKSDASARDWVGKLKLIGVPAYIEHVKAADGSERAMLRAGPFADRTVAQNAVMKVRQAGLSQAGK